MSGKRIIFKLDKEGRMRVIATSCFLVVWFLFSCSENEQHSSKRTIFNLVDADVSQIHFQNQLEHTENVNTYTFKNFYNGGGVAIGDINNDQLPDILFAGNLVSNKLYLNKGNFRFEDISASSGIAASDTWSTGVCMVDINNDRLLDIYVCKSGPPGGSRRHNELFINNGDLTFTEKSEEYGLDFVGLSTQAAFFDYDKDGDLDCYLLNNSIRSVGAYDLRKDQRQIPDPQGGNKLLRNDGGKFIDVSQQAGIYTSMIGFGLGVTIGDINKDGWPDIYISNDFFEKDYLYINQKDGTFLESLESMIRETSLGSMGADLADINNDGLPEIFVTEMLPEDDARLKTKMQFENWDKYKQAVDQGYYHQFNRNVLQLNNGDGTFSEIGRLAKVEATDWSWGALIFDMNNDGLKDIFVANGIYKDLLDQDYMNFASNRTLVRQILNNEGAVIRQLIDSIPSNKLANFAFKNTGSLSFQNQALEWGLGNPTHSNGSAYGDLDNDGDLDLVLNNVNMPAHVYENLSNSMLVDNHYVSVLLYGEQKNTFGLGTKVTITAGDKKFYQEHFPTRGFMSSVDYRLHFGLGKAEVIDSLVIEWPDDRVTVRTNLRVDTVYHFDNNEARLRANSTSALKDTFFSKSDVAGVNFIHRENNFVDFNRDRLLFKMISTEGPCLCTGDVNADGLDDFYVGGAKGQAGRLFIQSRSGGFKSSHQQMFEQDKESEDTDCVFFDADNDGRQDLYVTSGGSEFSAFSPALVDRLYFNHRGEQFKRSAQMLPVSTRFESTSAVAASDYDRDGDQDLFVGTRLSIGKYGVPCNGYLLRNDGHGHFDDVSKAVAPTLQSIGLITDAKWADVNNDSLPDLIVVGEWMPIKIYINHDGKTLRALEGSFEKTNGWYHAVEAGDFNRDGWQDLVFGNHGLNSRFRASQTEPIQLHVNDFDDNGSVEQITTRYYGGKSLPIVLRQDLVMEIPSLKKKYLHFRDYPNETINDMFTPTELEGTITLNAFDLETTLWLNNRDGSFTRHALPVQAQFSPVYALHIDDVDGDGNLDLLMGGNLYRAKPETGIYDGSYGLLLQGDGRGEFTVIASRESGISIKGEVRAVKTINGPRRMIAVAKNNSMIEFFTY